MGINIIISSAVELEEKEWVKEKLLEMEKLQIIKINDLYDCADHATLWGVKSKQEIINQKILSADWFICLIPERTVGKHTWKELRLVLEAQKRGLSVAVSVCHPDDMITDDEFIDDDRVSFGYVKMYAELILGNNEGHYWLKYQGKNKENLQKLIHKEFINLYYTDKFFRAQHLGGLAKLGRDIEARDLYFDTERADINNGFFWNKYFPRRSVDGRLQEALIEQRKFIFLLGAPGSGKTRAIYQLMADPQQLIFAGRDRYALGELANQNVIIVNQDNIYQVYQFLESEKDYDESTDVLSGYFLVIDQLKDVFGMLTNDELFRFVEMTVQYKHVHMIGTSIPSAFKSLCDRWKDYGRKPFEDDMLTKIITIPQISCDGEEIEMRNWMQNELQGKSPAETIGDYIPFLNNYKQNIVKNIYRKIGRLPYLSELLSAVQIIESFRNDTALFLPILVLRKNVYSKNMPDTMEGFYQKIIKVLNFLIENNVIWVRQSVDEGRTILNVKKMDEKAFSLDPDIDLEEDFIFDGEIFPETPISTSYSYGVNEIVWDELEIEDAKRHFNNERTLLGDFQKEKDVVRAAKEFYRAFPEIVSLKRILPRIPHTDCYDKVSKILWGFIFNKCKEIVPTPEERDQFLLVLGILIGRSKDMEQIKEVIGLIQEKGLKPNYNIIGELYSVRQHLDKETRSGVLDYVISLRDKFQMNDENFFSLSRKITSHDWPFDVAMDAIWKSNYEVQGKNETLPLLDAVPAIQTKIEASNVSMLLLVLAKRCETTDQWIKTLNLHKKIHVNLKRSQIRHFFSVVSDQSKRLQNEPNNEEPKNNLLRSQVQLLMDDYGVIIDDEDKASCFFYAVEASWNFKQSYSIYQLYYETFKKDNPRLISMMLHTVRNFEFQRALKFLIEVDERLKALGSELNIICFNNLIKSAPNMGEALGVVPYLRQLQDYTLVSILNVLKSKRRLRDINSKTGIKMDSKMFYYAYSAVMRDEFFCHRKSPYVIGVLYDLATTPKHERFIRETFLNHLEERERREIIDYSTTITSIRLKKNYRTLHDAWDIFITCRNHYCDENMFVNSELYSNLMRKIMYLCTAEEERKEQVEKLRHIIAEDSSRIIRDEYFYSMMYRVFPEKQIFDDQGNMSSEFINEITNSAISQIKILNNIMGAIKNRGFEFVWKFYEFMVSYYKKSGKRKQLSPEIRTVTYLMETVVTKEQFRKAENAAKKWCVETTLRANKLFMETVAKKRIELGLDKPIKSTEGKSVDNLGKKVPSQTLVQNFKQRVDDVICSAIADIYNYDGLTPTLLNRYLKSIDNVMNDIEREMKYNIAKKYKAGIYRNVMKNLIERYSHELKFDAISYVYLIKFSSSDRDVERWLEVLKEKESVYRYDMVVCAAISQNIEVCNANIDIALDYFEFWEDIVHDIGYDPGDPTSVSETTEITKYYNVDDYDGYWWTRSQHCIREMHHYWQSLKRNGVVDKTALKLIKQQLTLFDQFQIPFPVYKYGRETMDFRKEVEKLE